jgi:hypothetical protein
MTEPKFTPGPWWFEEDEYCWQLFGGQSSQMVTVGNIAFESPMHPRQILKAPKKDTPYAEYWPQERDAALIVASPDLYAACEAQEEHDEHFLDCDTCCDGTFCETGAELSYQAQKIRAAALAKARGGA